jgi:hypothetical protein
MKSKKIKIIATILFILICIMPGSKAGFFNSLPLSALEMIFSILIILGIFITPWEENKKSKIAVFLCLFLFLFFQAISYKTLPYGWSVCTSGNTPKVPLKTKCEPTIENPSGNLGYIYTNINFNSKNIPLYFFNNYPSFGYYRKGEPKRNTLTFNIEATTYIASSEKSSISAKSDSDLLIKVNDENYEYKAGSEKMKIALQPNSTNRVQVNYTSIINKDRKVLNITTDGQPFYQYRNSYPENFVYIYRTINYLLLTILAVCFVYSFILLFLGLNKKHQFFIFILIIALILLIIFSATKIFNFKDVIVYSNLAAIFSSFVFIIIKDEKRKKILPFIFITFLVLSCILTTCRVLPEEAQILPAGEDELTHESFTRQFIPLKSFDEFMHATDKGVFYYQPLQRYFLFLLHIFFGEPMWGPYVFQMTLYYMSILLIVYSLKKYAGLLSAFIFCVLYVLLFAVDSSHNIVRMITSPLQQALALPLLLIVISMILLFYKSKNIKNYLCLVLGLLLGISFMMRTDWFPIILFLLILSIYVLWIKTELFKTKKIFLLILGFIIFPLLIGYRNYHVANQFTIFTSSTYVNLTRDLYIPLAGKFEGNKASGSQVLNEITILFHNRYGEFVNILWNNINQNIIEGDFLQKSLWYAMLPLFILSAIFEFKKKKYRKIVVQTLLLLSLLSMLALASFFKQHNGLAMKAIYNILLILIISISFQTILELFKKIRSNNGNTE